MRRLMLLMFALLSLSAVGLRAQATSAGVKTIPVESMAANVLLSPDDHTLAVYNNYQIYNEAPTPELIPITLYDTRTGEQIGTLSAFTDWVTGLDFNSDGSQLISLHRNGDLNLWNVADLSLIKTIPTYMVGGGWVQFLPDDHSVLYRASDMLIAILDTENAAITHQFGTHFDSFDQFTSNYTQFPGRGDVTFAAAAVSPDGRWLATSTANDAVDLWDTAGSERWELRPKSEQMAQFSIRSFVFSDDSTRLVYFDSGDKRTHIWDVTTRKEVAALDFGALPFDITPDGAKLAWVDRATNAVYVADALEGAEPLQVLALPDDMQVAPVITSVTFTSDASQAVVGGLVSKNETSDIYVVDLAP